MPSDRPQRDQPLVSVVFSFRNEADVLPELIRRLRAVFALLQAGQRVRGYELIFVNDRSSDASEAILRRAADEAGDVRIVTMSRTFGVAPCLVAGLRHARGDAVVYMDTDLQDPPEVIPELLEAWQQDPEVDVVHTVRRVRLGETRFKRAITHLGYRVLRAVSQIDLPHQAGDFKLLSRRVARHLADFPEREPFLRGLVCWLGFKQATVLYDRAPRFRGRSKFPVLSIHVIRHFFDTALISFSDLPLRLPTFAGVALLLLGGLLCLAQCAAWWQAWSWPAWLPTVTAVLGVGGLQLLCLGIFGQYLAAVYWQSKRRPPYVVHHTYGFENDSAEPCLQEAQFDSCPVQR